jgi:hypothetical protein
MTLSVWDKGGEEAAILQYQFSNLDLYRESPLLPLPDHKIYMSFRKNPAKAE